MAGPDVLPLLELGLNRYERQLDAPVLKALAAEFCAWQAERDQAPVSPERGTARDLALQLVEFLHFEIGHEAEQLAILRQRHADFNRRYQRAATEAERRQHILDHARELGASARQLRGDRKAFGRWFGHDAIVDRYGRRHAARERKIACCLQRLGVLAALVLKSEGAEQQRCWQRLDLEKLVRPLLSHDGDSRVNSAAFRCLSTALRVVAPEAQGRLVDDSTLSFIYRSALDARQHVWIQCEALSLLQTLAPDSFRKVLEMRLRQPGEGDDLFVRRRAVRLLGENLDADPTLSELIPLATHDPSAHVRQGVAQALIRAPVESASLWLRFLAREDQLPQVRAAAVRAGLALLQRRDGADACLDLVSEVMDQETDELVLRVAIHVAVEGAEQLACSPSPLPLSPAAGERGRGEGEANSFLSRWQQTLVTRLDQLHTTAGRVTVRRWAAQARERIWCLTDSRARRLKEALQQELRSLPPGRSRRLPRGFLRGYEDDVVGRVLAVLAQEDFGLDLERRWWGTWITRGPVFRFRLWRFLYELIHADPAKRQAFRHTIGRVSYAQTRAPSAILAELAETKVPGEPLFLSQEGGWRPYLPLPDDVLSCLNQVLFLRPVCFYTSEGVTELLPPRSPLRRLWAYLRLNWSFAHYARLRNWREGDPTNPTAYLQALARLGVRIHFRRYVESEGEGCPADPAVTRFFPAAASLLPVLGVGPTLKDLWERFASYFSSLYENTIPELLLFTVLALGFFFGRHWYLNYRLRRRRARFPLVLGGWGTRGKSGTERLKAALVNALGYGLVSKTTGCEAMFLHAYPFCKTREMFLYRSYDKATIWEQSQVVQIADGLGTDVFLWECMALRPAYVRVLQGHWMRDDISTITNTYPDHEDVQGPAGVNIPEVIGEFIPPHSRLLTSEEQMRPILVEMAAQRGTTMRSVGWLEAGLLTPDVLKRFPYEEHPYNIALVLSLAEELGIDRDFALKEMADHVVPDLGVLKTSPAAAFRTRRLEFSNGMSANERHGCLNNWYRLGFDRQDPKAEPGVWITTVVNNRADRIPRSRVFAGVLVNDLSADRHFLIGGNLNGLVSYIEEAWQEYARTLTLWPETESGTPSDPVQVLESMTRRFRQPFHEAMIPARLRIMLTAVLQHHGQEALANLEALADLWNDPETLRARLAEIGCDARLVEAVVAHLSQDLGAWHAYGALAEKVRHAEPAQHDALNRALRELLGQWFRSKIVVISDYYASGDQIVERIAEETPPGFLNRIMGIQNIKGTGLDFVYRWEAWSACHRACTLLRSPVAAQAEQGLRELCAFQDYGLLCEEHVRDTIDSVRDTPLAQSEKFQTQLQLVLSNLETRMHALCAQLNRSGSQSNGWLAGGCSFIEAFLDAVDAVKRRRQADRIYKDLAAERIGHERAALELQDLNKRQKGGWLLKKLEGWLAGTHKDQA